jgi:hypothetical protein
MTPLDAALAYAERGSQGKYWVAPPSVKQLDFDENPLLDASNKPRWQPIVDFLVPEALRRQHPSAFDGVVT